MTPYQACMAVMYTIIVFLFGPRYLATFKDFYYFNPSHGLKRLLYVRKLPVCKISLASIAVQLSCLITLSIQLLSLLGVNVLEPLLSRTWFGRFAFAYPYDIYLQIVFCVVFIQMPALGFIFLYSIVCWIFIPRR